MKLIHMYMRAVMLCRHRLASACKGMPWGPLLSKRLFFSHLQQQLQNTTQLCNPPCKPIPCTI